MTSKAKGHLLRVCDLCGGVDDHPRHVVAGSIPGAFPAPTAEMLRRVMDAAPTDQADRLIAALIDTGGSDRHMDCCRESGCPDGTCDLWTRGAETKRGQALRTHLGGLTADDVVRLAEEIIAEGAPSIVKGE